MLFVEEKTAVLSKRTVSPQELLEKTATKFFIYVFMYKNVKYLVHESAKKNI